MKTNLWARGVAAWMIGSAAAGLSLTTAAQTTNPPAGLNAGDWSGIRTAHTAWMHSFRKADEGFSVRHAAHAWSGSFDSRGFTLTDDRGAWQWGLELQACGFPGALRRLTASADAPEAAGSRLTRRWDDNLGEWYVNDGAGLEHGFTLARRPDGGAADVFLTLDLAVRGSLRPEIADGGAAARFADAEQRVVLTYGGLKAFDADGKSVPARMAALTGGGLRLEIDDSAARYPLTIDPVVQPVYVKAHNTGGGDRFGDAVAMSGGTVVIGADWEDGDGAGVNPQDNNLAGESGAAYVFVRDAAGVWSQQAYLKAPNRGNGDYFGKSVAISSDTIVVGAYYEDGGGTGVDPVSNENALQAGAAYVYVRNNNTWAFQATLKASNSQANDQFGSSVAIFLDTIVVGAPQEDGAGPGGSGANPPVNEGANASGAIYVFVRNGSTWSQQAYVKASNPGALDQFGYSVALSLDTMVVGAWLEDGGSAGVNPPVNEGIGDSGAAYVFVRNGTTWSQQAYLKASNPGANDWFGYSVAVFSDTIVCGAPNEDGSGSGINPLNNNGAQDSGAAYLFERSGTTWSQRAYLKASYNGIGDQFGYAVGTTGRLAVIGAPYEDGGGARIDPLPDESVPNSGAVFTFTRTGGVWVPFWYLKATNPGADDLFGFSVAVFEDRVVAGAISEDGNGTGVNPPDTGTIAGSGAAYFFDDIDPLPDRDADAIPDVFEMYFGTNPDVPNPPPWTVSTSPGALRLRWPGADATGVTVVPQWSPDLITWLVSGESRNGIPARTITVLLPGVGGIYREAILNAAGLPRAALRLRLTCP